MTALAAGPQRIPRLPAALRPVVGVLLALLILMGLPPARAQDGPGVKMRDRGRTHVPQGTAVPYEDVPPTSGPHWPVVAEWGVYPEPIPDEILVHNLEHGGVVLLYRCRSECADLRRQLEQLFADLPKSKYGHVKVVIAPSSRIARPFALLAWTRLDQLDTLDRERIVGFVRAWQDRGPEDVP